ncbi:MAG: ABC transporter permease [Acidimicrobiales bacterium]|nr:ABC transporter permease [Acidimicrobiales bacterium]
MSPNLARTLKLVARKLAQLIVVLFCVTLFTFLLVRFLPGDPEDLLVPASDNTGDPRTDQIVREQKERVRADMGLDDPLPVQYWNWLSGFLTGDMGYEYGKQDKSPVSERLAPALPPTLQLILYSQVIALAVAIPLGVITAYKEGSIFDRLSNATAFGMLSLPNFAVALLLAYWIGVRSSLPFSPTGYTYFSEDPAQHFTDMVLPSITLAIGQIAIYMRLLRSDLIQTLQEDFILMARSKGISNSRVLWRHALRPSSLALLTVAGLNIGTLIGGTVVIEVLFGIQGMGSLIYESILTRQYLTLQSCVAIIAIGFVLINAVLDVLYNVLDPRIRHAS